MERNAAIRLALLALLFGCATFSVGCVSPGTGYGHVSVEGQLLNAAGDPLPGVEVEVRLPRVYGTRARDVAAGQAMDFTSPKRALYVVTDEQGRFAGDLGEHGYAVDFWVFPPRGPVPAAPPPPTFLVRLPGVSDEHYYVCSENGPCIVMRSDGSRISTRESMLSGGEATTESSRSPKPGPSTLARFSLMLDLDQGDRRLAVVAR